MVYIQTILAGRTVSHSVVTSFDSRLAFWAYVDEVLACHSANPRRSHTIAALCDLLADNGPGTGQRWHRRVSRRDAAHLIRQGATNRTWL